ncbi:hypothetical protein H9Q69_014365 [Fusarium xylarioides]|nr:hypothetical protein H9Q69_014365 [Fusarium xylarioides]
MSSEAPPRPRRSDRAKALREARETQQDVARVAVAKVAATRRVPACLGCLNSAMAGKSNGDCWQHGRNRRYERCLAGGSCTPIPPAALPVALYFLDYCQDNPIDEDGPQPKDREKDKRRGAVKLVLAGVADGTFPLPGDPRLS